MIIGRNVLLNKLRTIILLIYKIENVPFRRDGQIKSSPGVVSYECLLSLAKVTFCYLVLS